MSCRNTEWDAAVAHACHSQGLSQEQILGTKAHALLKPHKQSSEFIKVSKSVVQSISDLREFIKVHQKDYLSTSASISKDEKDKIEAEVGLLIKACTQQIEQLKNSVLVAQGSPKAPPASVQALKHHHQQQQQQQQAKGLYSSKPSINAQTAAHLHGVVLFIAELLHQVSTRFDKCRAQRYRQACNQRRPLSLKGIQQQERQQPIGTSISIPKAHFSTATHTNGPGPAQAVLNNFGTSFLGHVREARDALQGIGTPSALCQGQNDTLGQTAQQQLQLQQQQQLHLENQSLVFQLSSAGAQAQGIETTIQDVAVLNQMFSAAVLHQAESIESIYAAAVDASQHISAGNMELRRAVKYGRSLQRQMFVLLLAAALSLLFFDWFNS